MKAKENKAMTKIEYKIPTMKVVEMQHHTCLLSGSSQTYGMEGDLQEEEVSEGY